MADAPKTKAKAGGAERGWLGRKTDDAQKSAASKRRGDLTVAALGLTLGLSAALFPWYIFFNQDKFSIGGGQGLALVPGLGGGPKLLTPGGADDGRAAKDGAFPIEKLDLFATGTAPKRKGDEEPEAPTAAEQPFPAKPVRFEVVHIENGRAMIADDSGLFVVGRGDMLPDDTRVERIEKRDGRMVLVTSEDKVLEAAD